MVSFGIFDLRDRPQHADGVAHAVLRTDTTIPFALVAEIDGKPRGTCLVIDNDEAARPDLTPWLAAVWVDEAVRRRGIAAALLDEGARRSAALGIARLHLVSRPTMQSFYTRLGWRIVEQDVGELRHTLYVRELGAVPSGPKKEPSKWT